MDNKIDSIEWNERWEDVAWALESMDVPSGRITPAVRDLKWLLRNLASRNIDHPDYEAVRAEIKFLLRSRSQRQ